LVSDLGELVDCIFDELYEDGIVIGSYYSTVDVAPPGMTTDKRHTFAVLLGRRIALILPIGR
jgi:hypothetical protein